MLIVLYVDVSRLDLSGDYALSAYRRGRLSRLGPEDKRRQSLGAELLLNRAARLYEPGIELPLDIICGENGKPGLAGGGFCFSLSHSGGYAAAAVADCELGLDIQMLSHADRKLMERVFTPDEREYVYSAKDADAAFTELWCKKESYVKALGTGLGAGLASFSVMGMPIWHAELEGLHVALCVPGRVGIKPDIFEKIELP